MSDRRERLRVMRIIARMNVGGPAMQAVTLMRGLPTAGFDQRLYTGFVENDEEDYIDLRAPEVEVHRVRSLGRNICLGDDARALAELVGEMRQFRPHIVHTHTAKAGTLGRIAASLAGVPVRVHTFHGHLLKGYFSPNKARLVTAVERALAKSTDRLVAVGSQVRDELLQARVGSPTQYTVVPPGTQLSPLPDREVARQQLGLPVTGPVVAYVGRLTRIKRPDRLIATARDVVEAIPDAQLLVCGEGDLLDEVSSDTSIDRSIRLLGWRKDVETVYAAADVVLLTSDNEGMPVSLIEAALAGVPAVATKVGSVAEVVEDGYTGFLSPCDPSELACRVIRLLRDDALRQKMGVAAMARGQVRFGADRLVLDIQDLYETIAVDRGWWSSKSQMPDSEPLPDPLEIPASHRVAQ